MKKIPVKKILNGILLISVFGLTLWSVFGGEDLKEVWSDLQYANLIWLIPTFFCIIGFILGESVVIEYMLRNLGIPVRFSRCCLFSFIGFFYSCITPSASGGQPMQIFYMRKDGIPTAMATVVLAIVTITYKLVLVLVGAAVLIIRPQRMMTFLEPVEWIMYLGLGLNVICIGALLLLVFDRKLAKGIVGKTIILLGKIRLLKRPERWMERAERVFSQYEGTAEYYRSHRRVIGNVLLITVIQRFLLFAITWFVYVSFSLTGYSAVTVMTLQGMISVAADMLPLPGGMGVSENLFLEIFQGVFGQDLVLPAMVLSRGISYYTQLLVSGVMTVVAMFVFDGKRKREKK